MPQPEPETETDTETDDGAGANAGLSPSPLEDAPVAVDDHPYSFSSSTGSYETAYYHSDPFLSLASDA